MIVEEPIGSMTDLSGIVTRVRETVKEAPTLPAGTFLFRQRIPNWSDMPPVEFQFKSLEELLSNDTVHHYSGWKGFDRFVRDGNMLMIEQNGGDNWWVVGYVSDPTVLESLPVWSRA